MKLDKRMTKCIIAAIVLIVIVASAPALFRASVATGTEPCLMEKTCAELEVHMVNRGECDYGIVNCPGGTKGGGMLTTVTGINCCPVGGSVTFEQGYWGINPFRYTEIPIGKDYTITTSVVKPEYSFEYCTHIIGQIEICKNHNYYHTDTYIRPVKGDRCEGSGKSAMCTAKMGADGAAVEVNSYWGNG
jgi:hypothetical protein